jgi:hypothetical protein
MRELEGRAEALAGTFNAQNVANTLWTYATMGREPGAGVMRGLEGRAEALAGTFKAQEVANTLWAYAKMKRTPGTGMMRGLEGRSERQELSALKLKLKQVEEERDDLLDKVTRAATRMFNKEDLHAANSELSGAQANVEALDMQLSSAQA